MDRRLGSSPASEQFTFEYNGEPVTARAGETIAAALLASGVDVFSRSIKYHRPRGPYCLSGRCSHCLVRVDGVLDVMACMTPARPGSVVAAQNSYPSAKHDVLAAIDWMFPKGLNHHSMFAGVPVVEDAVAKVARHIAGLGPVPERAPKTAPPNERRSCDVAVVGAGPAGLACAHALRESGMSVEVLDERPSVGGRLLAGLEEPAAPDAAWAEATRAECERAGVRFTLGATVIAAYLDGAESSGGRLVAARLGNPDRMLLLRAQRVVFCTGAVEPLVPFEDNDLPGIYAGRALARFVRTQKVLPGERAVVVGSGNEALALARLLLASGAKVEALVDASGELRANDLRVLGGFTPVRAHGRHGIKRLEVRGRDGRVESLDCDLVAVLGRPAPGIELARQAGAFVEFVPEVDGYVVKASEDGRTSSEDVFAAGDVTGPASADRARQMGAAMGRFITSARQQR